MYLATRERIFSISGVIAVLPPATEVPELAPLDAIIAQEQDPAVLPLALVTRASEVNSPLFSAAAAHPALHRIATLHAARLGEGAKCYATHGTGLVTPLRELFGVTPPIPPPASPTPATPAAADANSATATPAPPVAPR